MTKTDKRTRTIYRVTLVGLVVNVVLSLSKLVAGFVGRSGAMVADAAHSFSDLATDIVVLCFARVSAKPKDERHPYGHGKYETLAAVIISLALLGAGAGILQHSIRSIHSILQGETLPRPGLIALVAAAISIVAKELLFRYTIRVGRSIDSPSVVANAWHHRSDALSSIGTLLGIGLAYFLGEKWRIADPIAALVVSFFIFKIAFRMLCDGMGELMERALPQQQEQEILDLIRAVPGVKAPHQLRTRRIGSAISIEVHVRVEPEMTVLHSHALTQQVEQRLKAQFGPETMINIHVEPLRDERQEAGAEVGTVLAHATDDSQ